MPLWSMLYNCCVFVCYKKREYCVCITAGSTLEAMALAVEKAAVVLVCMSQKYKNSPNCRTGTLALGRNRYGGNGGNDELHLFTVYDELHLFTVYDELHLFTVYDELHLFTVYDELHLFTVY